MPVSPNDTWAAVTVDWSSLMRRARASASPVTARRSASLCAMSRLSSQVSSRSSASAHTRCALSVSTFEILACRAAYSASSCGWRACGEGSGRVGEAPGACTRAQQLLGGRTFSASEAFCSFTVAVSCPAFFFCSASITTCSLRLRSHSAALCAATPMCFSLSTTASALSATADANAVSTSPRIARRDAIVGGKGGCRSCANNSRVCASKTCPQGRASLQSAQTECAINR